MEENKEKTAFEMLQEQLLVYKAEVDEDNKEYVKQLEAAKTIAKDLEMKVSQEYPKGAVLISYKHSGRKMSLFVDHWGNEDSLEDAVIVELCTILAGKINCTRINHHFNWIVERALETEVLEAKVNLMAILTTMAGADKKFTDDSESKLEETRGEVVKEAVNFLVDTYASMYCFNIATVEVAKEMVEELVL